MAALASLQDFLDRQGYPTERVSAANGLECLMTSLGHDDAGREVYLQLRYQFQPFSGTEQKGSGIHLWDFLVTFPFYANPTSFASVARLLSHLNKISCLSNFFLSEKDCAIFLHHTLLTEKDTLPEALMTTSLAAIIQDIDLFSLPIEEIAQEKRSLEDLLQAAQREHPLPSESLPWSLP